jgi:uncharacterized metal-binding protein
VHHTHAFITKLFYLIVVVYLLGSTICGLVSNLCSLEVDFSNIQLIK